MFDGIFQPTHLLLILVIVLIIFGPGKLPELGKALGQGIREFRDSTAGQATNPQAEPPQQPLPPQPYAPYSDQGMTPESRPTPAQPDAKPLGPQE